MFVKLMLDEGGEKVYECTHIVVTELDFAAKLKDNDGNSLTGGRTGLDIEICPLGITINLPRDGKTVYTTNDRGDTLHRYSWPPKPKPGPYVAPAPPSVG